MINEDCQYCEEGVETLKHTFKNILSLPKFVAFTLQKPQEDEYFDIKPEIPRVVTINNQTYKLLAISLFISGNHYDLLLFDYDFFGQHFEGGYYYDSMTGVVRKADEEEIDYYMLEWTQEDQDKWEDSRWPRMMVYIKL